MTDRGPADTYKVTYSNGIVEHVQAHQVRYSNHRLDWVFKNNEPNHVLFYGEVNGQWRLLLDLDMAYVKEVRLVTEEVKRTYQVGEAARGHDSELLPLGTVVEHPYHGLSFKSWNGWVHERWPTVDKTLATPRTIVYLPKKGQEN